MFVVKANAAFDRKQSCIAAQQCAVKSECLPTVASTYNVDDCMRVCTRMHYGKKAFWQRQCDA